ncbi:glucokinase [Salipiger sp.]|uniref:glucokinase n=1 Tax=Salipiger sp. TaxID=2078585 RepID=UPI003A96B778
MGLQTTTAVLADVGGTNTRVAISHGPDLDRESTKRFKNSEFNGIGDVLRAYLAESDAVPTAACVAVAGPVRDGAGQLTNIDWHIDRQSVSDATGAGVVSILNDLQAQGHALGRIAPEYLTAILPGKPAPDQSARLVIGVGTGMNAAPVFRLGNRTLVPPAEAGHTSLPVQSEADLRLLDFLRRKHSGPGTEDVLSGRGFEQVHAWLCEEDGAGSPLDAAEIMTRMEAGEDRPRRAVEVFSRILGRVCGNLALNTLPFGGIYLIGGVTRHFGPHLLDCGFAEAFRDKGRFSEFMDQFPVSLVTDDYAALSGCASHLTEQVENPD